MNRVLLEFAQYYNDLGFSIIPIQRRGKNPLIHWKEFMARKAAPTELDRWFSNDGRANVAIVTGAISGIIVIDLDGENAIDFVREKKFPETPAVRTARGFHLYYRYREGLASSIHLSGLPLDIKSDGGYVLAPPSVHPQGQSYEWLEGYTPLDMPFAEFPIDLLPKNENGVEIRNIDEIHKGVVQGERNVSLSRLLGVWLHYGLIYEECLSVARIWNARNKPPLPEAEVVRTVNSIWQRHVRSNLPASDDNGQLITLSDLFSQPDEAISWIWQDTLPSAGTDVLVAKPKLGKSTLARQLALHVSRGTPFLNRPTTQGSVIYLALEEKLSEIKRHFISLGAVGTEPIFIATEFSADFNKLKAIIEEKQAVFAIIDPLFKMIRVRDSNEYAGMSRAIKDIHDVARKTGAHIMMVHHATKGGQGADSILGSTALFGGVDTAIILRKDGITRSISSTQRYGIDIPDTTLSFDQTTRTISLGISQAAATSISMEQKILAFLSQQIQPVNEDAINCHVPGNSIVRSSALRNLVKTGAIEHTGAGRKGSPYLYAVKKSAPQKSSNPTLDFEGIDPLESDTDFLSEGITFDTHIQMDDFFED